MSDDEVLEFKVTEHDLESEFNPMLRRGKQSKKDQIYGVFAEDVDDGEVERPSFSKGGRNKYAKASYGYGGVSFVSAGIQPAQVKRDEEEEKKAQEDRNKPADSDSSSEDDIQFITTGKRAEKSFDFDKMAGMRTVSGGGGLGKGMEMYGIGAKMAMKMGYNPGKGLGKDEQGIVAPIEAKIRKGRGAIGAYGKETSSRIGKQRIEDPSTNLQKKQKEKPAQKWQKTNTAPKEKVEYKMLTMDQVLEKKNLISMVRPDAGALAKTKVIDMTGPQERVLSGYHAISGQQRPKDDEDEEDKLKAFQRDPSKFFPGLNLGETLPPATPFELPELLHNICLLEDACEQDIVRNDKKGRYASDRKIALIDERKKLAQRVEKQDKALERLEILVNDIKIFTGRSVDLDEAILAFARISKEYPEEWELYELYQLAPGVVIPALQINLKTWNPLFDPSAPYSTFQDWCTLLHNRNEAFETILWEAWMPPIRSAAANWNVKEPEPMLNLINLWRSLLPPWILSNLLDQIILPKINIGVEAWDPLSDSIPIHSWIHPWLPLLGAKLDLVYPTIRRKLASALQLWHPSDSSGKDIFMPWVNVFTKGAVESFILKNIIPKLQRSLAEELSFVPGAQDLGPWNWVMNWSDLIPLNTMVGIFESAFFPKWIQFLVGWLMQRPDFALVYQWYTWWRNLFPPVLIADPGIMGNIQKALEIISRAVQCAGQPMDMNYLLPQQQQQPIPQPMQPQFQAPTPGFAAAMSNVNLNFRDLVQMKCEELGLLFVPVQNRFYEGKQVYTVGNNTLIYISANVLYTMNNGMWNPISINQLLQIASSN